MAGELFVNLGAATFKSGDTTWANPGTYRFRSGRHADWKVDRYHSGRVLRRDVGLLRVGFSPRRTTGVNPTRSIEMWTLNPEVAQEETVLSWATHVVPAPTCR